MFYKLDNDNLLQGDTINSPVVTLTKETKDEFTYPQDCWYWFNTIEEAKNFFGVKDEIQS